MAGLADLFGGGGGGMFGGDPGGLFGDLLTPQQKQALAYRGLMAAAGAFGQAAMPTRMPTPIGAVLGQAAAAMGESQDTGAMHALKATLLAQQAQQMKSEMETQAGLMKLFGLDGSSGGGSSAAPSTAAPGATATPSAADRAAAPGGVVDTVLKAGGGAAIGAGNPGSLAMEQPLEVQAEVAKKIATTSGLQHWAGSWNPKLQADLIAAGLPISGPVTPEQWAIADPLVKKRESYGGLNVPNYRFDKTHTAGGSHQITNSTWNAFGGPEIAAAMSSGQPTVQRASYTGGTAALPGVPNFAGQIAGDEEAAYAPEAEPRAPVQLASSTAAPAPGVVPYRPPASLSKADLDAWNRASDARGEANSANVLAGRPSIGAASGQVSPAIPQPVGPPIAPPIQAPQATVAPGSLVPQIPAPPPMMIGRINVNDPKQVLGAALMAEMAKRPGLGAALMATPQFKAAQAAAEAYAKVGPAYLMPDANAGLQGDIAGAKERQTAAASYGRPEFNQDLQRRLGLDKAAANQGGVIGPNGFAMVPNYGEALAGAAGQKSAAEAEAQQAAILRREQEMAMFNVNPNAIGPQASVAPVDLGGGLRSGAMPGAAAAQPSAAPSTASPAAAPSYGPGATEPLPTPRGTVIPPITAAAPIVGSPKQLEHKQTGPKGWTETEGQWAEALAIHRKVEQGGMVVAEILKKYESGAAAGELSDIRAKLRAIGVDLPESVAGDPAEAQKIIKYNFTQVISSMKGFDSNPAVYQVKLAFQNWANPNIQPGTNHAILAQTVGAARQQMHLQQDFAEAKKYGWRDPQDFDRAWGMHPENTLQAFVDRASKEIGPLKGEPGGPPTGTPKRSFFDPKTGTIRPME